MTIKSGRITKGTFRGQRWEITRQETGATYRLDINGKYYTSSDSMRELLDELEALDGLTRGC